MVLPLFILQTKIPNWVDDVVIAGKSLNGDNVSGQKKAEHIIVGGRCIDVNDDVRYIRTEDCHGTTVMTGELASTLIDTEVLYTVIKHDKKFFMCSECT